MSTFSGTVPEAMETTTGVKVRSHYQAPACTVLIELANGQHRLIVSRARSPMICALDAP
jgi:hypothetical protein